MKRMLTLVCLVVALLAGVVLTHGSLPQVASGTWMTVAPMNSARSGASAVLLQDGRVLITGGDDANGPTNSAEFSDTGGVFFFAPAMLAPRSKHISVVLQDGRVLVAGGTTSGGGVTNAAEIFDPTTGSWSNVGGGMIEARTGHTATLLIDGRVLLAGGNGSSGTVSLSAEIFDPSTGSFSIAGVMASARTAHAAALLLDGRVLIVGGSDGANTLATSDIFDPSSNSISAGPNLLTPREGLSATTLLDGTVLIAGGNNGQADLATAEIFDPAAGAFTALNSAMSFPRRDHQAFLLPNNNSVLIVGGTSGGQLTAAGELFIPSTGTFQATPALGTPRTSVAGSAVQQDGLFMVAGGKDVNGAPLASTELYGFATIKTDKSDYEPGDTVTITGAGWQPGESVTLVLVESPLLDIHGPFLAVADANGNISDSSFTADIHDLNIRFTLTATGSVSRAQTAFKDSHNITSVTLNGSSSVTVAPGATISAAVTGNVTFFDSWNGTGWRISTTSGTLTCVDTPNHFSDGTSTETFNITAPVTPGTYNAYFNTYSSSTCGSGTGTLFTMTSAVIVVTPVATTTTVTSSLNPSTYGDSVTFTAKVDPASGSTIPTGSVQFKVDGVNLGSAVTVAGGACGVSPAGCATSGGTATLTVAGSPHTVVANFVGSGSFGNSNGTLTGGQTVTKATPTLSVTNSPVTYNGSPQAATVSGSVPGTASNVRYNGSATVPTNAATYAITADFTPTDTANYNSLTGASAGSFVINKATPTLSVTNSPVTYNGSPQAATVSGSVAGTVSNIKYNASATVPTNAATYAITADFAPTDTTNYNSLTGASAGNFVINKVTPTLSVTNSPVTYNGSPQAATVTGSVAGTVSSVRYNGSATVPTNVATYAITANFTPTDTTNYNSLTAASAGNFVINKATPTLSVTNSPVTYNGSPRAATVTGSVAGTVSSVRYNGLATVPTNAATYAITADFAPTDTTNYNSLTGASAGNFVINKVTPTLSVTNSPVTYNGLPQAATVSGSVAGTVSNIKYNASATVPTNAATYAITADFAPTDTTNYNSLTAASAGNFVISKVTPTLLVTNSPVAYNGSPQAATVTGSVAGTVSSVRYNGSATVPTNVATYAITANFTPTDSTDYNTLSGASAGNFVISQASTTTTLVSGTNPSTLGESVTFTATVAAAGGGTPTGPVLFLDGTSLLGSANLSAGTATFTTSLLSTVGSPHSITANYADDANFLPSTSNSVSQVVNKRATTTGVVLGTPSVIPTQSSTVNVTVTDTGTAPPGVQNTWVNTTGNMSTGRTGHTMTAFDGGKVLVAGGVSGTTPLNTAQVFDPATGTFANTGNLNTARTGATATLLPNGKVLIAGGQNNGCFSFPIALNSAELYDGSAGTFANSGHTLSTARVAHTATLLQNGTVLIAGGQSNTFFGCIPGNALGSAEIYTPSTDSFANTGNLTTTRTGATATLLPNGKVLVTGGTDTSGTELSSAELYDPIAGTWSATGSMSGARTGAAATLLLNGKVLITGGSTAGTNATALATTQIYDPAAGTFSAGPTMNTARWNHTVTLLLPSGMVLAAGGANSTGNLSSAELYDPDSNRWYTTGSMLQADQGVVGTLLNNGQVLITGLNAANAVHNEIYSPSFDPLGTVALSSPQATDAFGAACILTPAGGGVSNCSSSVTPAIVDTTPRHITGDYPGDLAHATSNGFASLTVTGRPTSTTVTLFPTSVAVGSPSDASVTVTDTSSSGTKSNPGGTVVMASSDTGDVFGTCTLTNSGGDKAVCTVSVTPSKVGTSPHDITATFTANDGKHGDSNNTGSPASLTVTKGTSSTAVILTTGTTPSTYGDSVSFTATVTGLGVTPSGSVSFYDGGTCGTPGPTLASAVALDGTGHAGFSTSALTFSGSPHTILACFSGDANYNTSNGSTAQSVSKKGLTASIIGDPTKPYDGNTTATLTSANYSLTGLVGSESITVNKTSGTYDSKDVATADTVTASLAAGDFAAGVGTVLANYTLPTTASGPGHITTVTLTASIIGDPTKPYNGNTTAALTSANFSIAHLVGSESFTVTQTSGTYNSKDVVTAATVTASLAAGDFTPTGGALASNYVLPTTASGAGHITAVTLTASIIGDPTKPYDGNTNATLTSANFSIAHLVGSESFTVTKTTGIYDFKDVLTATTVTTSLGSGDFAPAVGTLASNYTLPTTASGPGHITAVTLTASIIGNPGKPYDGNTDATLTSANFSLSPLVGSESFTVTKTSGSYNSKDVASAATVTTSLAGTDFTAGAGTLASNYTLPTTASGAGHINAVTLTASIIGDPGKPYDGNTTATLAAANFSLATLVGSESFTVTKTSGTYNTKDVATATSVTTNLAAGDFTAGAGTLASNYTLPTTASGAGHITAVTLTASIIGDPTKPYNGNTDATLAAANFSLATLVGSESFTVTKTTGSYNSPDVATANTASTTLSAGDFTATNGAVASNYTLPTTASGAGHITAVTLTASIIGDPTKPYNGNTDATLAATNFSLATLVGSESFTVTKTTGSYNTKDVATATSVTTSLVAGDFTAGAGTLVSNYTLPTTASGAGHISAITLTASIIGDPTKPYNGNTDATLGAANFSLATLVGSESFTVTKTSGTYNTKDVATATSVTTSLAAGDFTAGAGTLASNYTLPITASGAGHITAITLTITANDKSKTFGGTDPVFDNSYSGFVNNENGSVLGGSAVFNFAGKPPTSYGPSTTVPTDAGIYAVRPSGLTSSNYAITFKGGTYTINQATPTVTVTILPATSSIQYSDIAKYTVKVEFNTPAGNYPGTGTIEFTLNGSSYTYTGTLDSGGQVTWTTPQVLLAPKAAPGYPVTATFYSSNPNFTNGTPYSGGLTVTQEDARVAYGGNIFVGIPLTATTAPITLAATIQDITAAVPPSDPAYDPYPGDIRNATVTFVNRDASDATLCTAPVQLVNSSDAKTGTVSCTYTGTVGSTGSTQFTVGIKVGGYYIRNASTDNTIVTISQVGTGMITGGGYVVLQSSAGMIAGDPGSKNNYGFNVQYKQSGSNPHGNINAIVRKGGRVYQIKGNSMSSLSTFQWKASGTSGSWVSGCTGATATAPCRAQFNGKANITDITNPAAPLSLGGNCSLQFNMTDYGTPGAGDTIGISLWDGSSGALWYSNNWVGTPPVTMEMLVSGGNLVVH